jgi:hypothetical protein
VVEDGDAAEFAHLPESGGQFQVLARRRRIPRRVVVAEDDRGRGAADEGAKHVARMHLDPGQRSTCDAGFEQDAMAHIERQHPEFLDRRGPKAGPVVCPDIGSIAEKPAALGPRSGHPAAKLNGGLNGRCTRVADPWQRTQFGFRTLCQTSQIARVGQQIMSDFNDILPLTAGAKENG